jgi:hypothetical protein
VGEAGAGSEKLELAIVVAASEGVITSITKTLSGFVGQLTRYSCPRCSRRGRPRGHRRGGWVVLGRPASSGVDLGLPNNG